MYKIKLNERARMEQMTQSTYQYNSYASILVPFSLHNGQAE